MGKLLKTNKRVYLRGKSIGSLGMSFSAKEKVKQCKLWTAYLIESVSVFYFIFEKWITLMK